MELLKKAFLSLSIFFLVQNVATSNIGGTRQDILQNQYGGYENLLIAISKAVPEDLTLVEKLKKHFQKASEVLLMATENQVYFSSITILIPNTWKLNSSWEVATKETFNTARVLIGPANRAWGDVPYTLQPGLCGIEGDYIHLTPDFITTTTTTQANPVLEKNIVKEFAHLKWGLFDEGVSVTDAKTPVFYSVGGFYQPTRCGNQPFYGRTISTNTKIQCDYSTIKTSEYCQYVPSYTAGGVSLLYAHQLSTIKKFCSEEDHNRDAPNRQNRICQEKSAWEVMTSLPDFATDYFSVRNAAGIITSSGPTFNVIQEPGALEDGETETTTETTTTEEVEDETPATIGCPQDVVCMALDVSGSMATQNRVTKMSDAVATYINEYLRNGTAAGIVTFNNAARTLASLTVITNDQVRTDLASVLPKTAGGSTSITSGLNTCIEMVRLYSGNSISKKRILLLSDGEDPTVEDILPELPNLNITIDTIIYGQNTDLAVPKIAADSGGKSYFADDDNPEISLQQAMVDTSNQGCSEKAIVSIASRKKTVSSTDTSLNGTISFDSTIGQNTTLVFSYSGTTDIDVNVTSAKGNNITITKDLAAKVVKATVEGQANDDDIEYTITKANPNDVVEIVVSVTSKPIPDVDPIVINTRLNSLDISFDEDSSLVIYTDIFQGLTPVLNLTVYNVIKPSIGNDLKLKALDDGTGKDSTPDDGIYTAVLLPHQFSGDGYYSIQVEIDGESVLPGSPTNRVKRCVDCAPSSLGTVQRTKSGGVITVANYRVVPDTTPPERIKDLVVGSGNTTNNTTIFTLSWTAPGNDLNVGRAAGYTFFVSNDSSTNNLKMLPNNHKSILTNVSSLLVDAGTNLELKLDFEQLEFGDGSNVTLNTYYIRMVAEDDKGNQAEHSNPVSLTIADPRTINLWLPTTTTSTTTTTEAITTTTFSIDQLVTTPADISDVKTAPMSKQMLLILGLGISGGVVCLLFIAVFIILIVKHKNGKTKCSIVFKGEKTDQTENVNIIVLN